MPLLYFVLTDSQAPPVGKFAIGNQEFCGLRNKRDAIDHARRLWRNSSGQLALFIHRIDAETCGKKICETKKWEPNDADIVWLVEKKLSLSTRVEVVDPPTRPSRPSSNTSLSLAVVKYLNRRKGV